MAGNVASGFGDNDDSLLSDINVTPLVDVTLVLLIVFMITVPAIVGKAPIEVNLPESGSVAVATEALSLPFSLRRSDAGEYVLYLNDKPTTGEEIRQMIDELRLSAADQPVSLAADKTIPYGEVVKVMDLLHSLGLSKISLDTVHVNSL